MPGLSKHLQLSQAYQGLAAELSLQGIVSWIYESMPGVIGILFERDQRNYE